MAPSSPIDPLVQTYSMETIPVSKQTIPIAGIQCDVYGLQELPDQTKQNLACLFLLHPRLGSKDDMEVMARLAIKDWNDRLRAGNVSHCRNDIGLIAVAFDQRNHGSRLVDHLANESWRGGNPRHAQDMITTAAILISTPDYGNLMADRARLSKLDTWTTSNPPGSVYLGSESFPPSLIRWLERQDPAEMLLSHMAHPAAKLPVRAEVLPDPSESEKQLICPIIHRCFSGKRLILISGGADKLVPYATGAPFLNWFKKGLSKDGWCQHVDVVLEDMVVENAGHEVTPQ
ncbi:hypothetical protein KEM54_006166, partial [Ascosphaera aggregata]